MRELKECLSIKRKIDDIDEKIKTIKVAICSPKNQVITGMPRSGSSENAIERYLVKLEKLEKQKQELLDYQHTIWEKACKKLIGITDQERELLYKRFVKGMPWKKCAFEMNNTYGGWNTNKAFRVYGRIKKLFQNNKIA